MVKLTGVFSQIRSRKVLVIGDLLLDAYTIGKARRISPEAPVPVVHVQREERRPGGAGNVILNLVSLGSQVVAVGRIGQDSAGETLKHALNEEGVDTKGIFTEKGYSTPVKNRIICDNQQVVRIDHESNTPIPELLEQRIIEALPVLLKEVRVVAISDYGKGFLSKTLLAALIDLARQSGILVIADPKGIDFSRYAGVHVIKPNLGEAYAAANMPPEAPLEQVASRLLHAIAAETLMVTRSEAGISLFHRNGMRHDFPVRVREVKDVTGAGDTVLAMVTCALANDLPLTTAAQLSNVAAGIALEHMGCARVSLQELARRLLEEDVGNKIFDEEHLFALQNAIGNRPFALLSIDSRQGLSSIVFSAIHQLAQQSDRDLLLYIRDEQPNPQLISLLASLHDVDFILINSDNLKTLCSAIAPAEVYAIENDQYKRLDSIDALLGSCS